MNKNEENKMTYHVAKLSERMCSFWKRETKEILDECELLKLENNEKQKVLNTAFIFPIIRLLIEIVEPNNIDNFFNDLKFAVLEYHKQKDNK